MSTPMEMAQILADGYSSGHGVVLVMPNGKPFLGCRGEFLSVTGGDIKNGRNTRFTAKQCKRMYERLVSELLDVKVTITRKTHD